MQSVQVLTKKEVEPIAVLNDIIRGLMIHQIDKNWQEHLLHIDHLRDEVGMHAVAQRDPLLEFKHEAFHLFAEFSEHVRTEIAHGLFKFEMAPPQKPTSARCYFKATGSAKIILFNCQSKIEMS